MNPIANPKADWWVRAGVRADEVTADSRHVQRDKTMSQRGVTDQTFNHRGTARGILSEGIEVRVCWTYPSVDVRERCKTGGRWS